MIAAIIIGTFVFMRFMTVSKLPFALSGFVSGLTLSSYAVLAIIVFLCVILGMGDLLKKENIKGGDVK
jgi:TRAP-type C4-dicarboxylate transport system permease large subunit